ncbi:MAG: sodium/hydrogen exchanger [Dehalococcoidia bacterium]|nr:sodium/hydrogen exchanger [Dehalococcoidia bacterium]
MEEVTSILKDIFIIYAAAKLVGELFEWAHQPAVMGELLVGVVLGPHALGILGVPSQHLVELFGNDPAMASEGLHIVYEVLAQIGVIVLLFFVGLETRLSDMTSVGRRALVVALLGILLPFVFGFALIHFLDGNDIEAAFLGAAMVATSVGITARVMRDMGVIQSREARIILGAAVIDDVLGLLILAVVSGMGGGKEFSAIGILVILAEAIAFTLFTVLIGTHLVRRYSLHWTKLRTSNAPFIIAVICMFGLAALAGYIGLAAIVGAFFAGMMLAEAREQYELEQKIIPVYEMMVPFFFVVIGMQVDWKLFLDTEILGLAASVTGLAVLGKVLGCGAGAWGMGKRSMAIIGVGMVPRGEVGLIVASLGMSLGTIPHSLFSTVVVMSVVTTIITPPLLKLLYRGAVAVEPIEAEPPFERAGHLPDM